VGNPWVESVVGTAEDIKYLTWIFHQLLWRDREDGCACPPCKPARQSPDGEAHGGRATGSTIADLRLPKTE
jgi:hypothetical protein